MGLVDALDMGFIRIMNFADGALSVETIVNEAKSGENRLAGAEDISKKTQALGNSAFGMVFKAAIIAILCGLVVAGVQLAFADENERREKKAKIIWSAAGTCVVVGATALVIFLSNAAPQMFGAGE